VLIREGRRKEGDRGVMRGRAEGGGGHRRRDCGELEYLYAAHNWAGNRSLGCIGLVQKSGRARAEDAAQARPDHRAGQPEVLSPSCWGSSVMFFRTVPMLAQRAWPI
jgi:hypothetical protein